MRPGLRFHSGQAGCSGALGQPVRKAARETKKSVLGILASIAMANVRTKTEKLNLLGPEPIRPLGRRLAKRIPITKRAYPERCNGTTCHTNHEKVLDVWQGGSRSPSALFQSGNRYGPPTSPRTQTCPLPTPTPCLSQQLRLAFDAAPPERRAAYAMWLVGAGMPNEALTLITAPEAGESTALLFSAQRGRCGPHAWPDRAPRNCAIRAKSSAHQ